MKRLLPALALPLLTAVAAAQCPGDPGFVLSHADEFPIGAGATLDLTTPGQAFVLFFVSLGPGPSRTRFGDMCVDMPALVQFPLMIPASGQGQFSCNVPCDDSLAGLRFHLQFLALNPRTREIGLSNGTAVDLVAGECEEHCPAPALDDRYALYSGDHALTFGCVAGDLIFDTALPHLFVENGDGTADLSGVVYSRAQPSNRWNVSICFTERVNPGDASYPPAGSPKRELKSSAYVDQQGPVDPSTWHYYREFSGTLTGVGANQGCSVQVSRRGPAFQVGVGANGKNIRPGASGWLDAVRDCGHGTQTCVGDINIDLEICR